MKRYLAVLKRHPPSAPPMDGWMGMDAIRHLKIIRKVEIDCGRRINGEQCQTVASDLGFPF